MVLTWMKGWLGWLWGSSWWSCCKSHWGLWRLKEGGLTVVTFTSYPGWSSDGEVVPGTAPSTLGKRFTGVHQGVPWSRLDVYQQMTSASAVEGNRFVPTLCYSKKKHWELFGCSSHFGGWWAPRDLKCGHGLTTTKHHLSQVLDHCWNLWPKCWAKRTAVGRINFVFMFD